MPPSEDGHELTSFVVSIHLGPVLQSNPGSRWNPPVLAKIFPARLSEVESLQLSFSSPVFPSFTHRFGRAFRASRIV